MMARRKIEVPEPAACLTRGSRSVDALRNPISLGKKKGPIVVITAGRSHVVSQYISALEGQSTELARLRWKMDSLWG